MESDTSISLNPGHADSKQANASVDSLEHNADRDSQMTEDSSESGEDESHRGMADHVTADRPWSRISVPSDDSEGSESEQSDSDLSDIDCPDIKRQSMDDATSGCTVGLNAPPSKRDAYISSLAHHLLHKALRNGSNEEGLKRACKGLPQRLKTFATKIGSGDPESIGRKVMVFVDKCINEIADRALQYYFTDKCRYYLIPRGFGNGHCDDPDEADRATDSLPELSVYEKFVLQHSAYGWLWKSIRKDSYIETPGAIQANIRRIILGQLSIGQGISKRESPDTHVMAFTVDWDPALFLREQGYSESPESAVGRVITITGSEIEAQAMTTAQYLDLIWPSSGIYLLNLIKRIVCGDELPINRCLPGKIYLVVRSREPKLGLEVYGTAESIADIGEQLAWLGSALRSSPEETGVAIVEAFVSSIGMNPNNETARRQGPKFFCNIDFRDKIIAHTDDVLDGQYWYPLFQSPVIASGFPIRQRPMSHEGLEMSQVTLEKLMGRLTLISYDEGWYIKGFSRMLVPARHSDDFLLWHMIYKKNGDEVSSDDAKEIYTVHAHGHQVMLSRHILGRCSQAIDAIGKPYFVPMSYNHSNAMFAFQ